MLSDIDVDQFIIVQNISVADNMKSAKRLISVNVIHNSNTINVPVIFYAIIFLYIFSSEAVAQSVITYSASGTWISQSGMTSVTVQCWGGGGAGGGVSSGSQVGGGGGAGGAYVRSILNVTPSTSYTVTVGTSVTGGTGNGSAGNPSWFGSASTIYAQGGAGGTAAITGNSGAGGSGSAASSIGDIKYAGGNGASGTNGSNSGGGGGGAGSTGSGGNATGITAGSGTPSNGGNGGAGRTSAGPGLSGLIYGGAGGGGYTGVRVRTRNGGTGAQGYVTISYFTLTGTSALTPVCTGSTSVITISSGSLPAGSYTVTYNLTGANNATNSTAALTVSTPGTGIFTTSVLPNPGSTTITITNLASATIPCSSSVAANNSAVILVTDPYQNVSGVSASEASSQSILSWTNPAGCFDEIMIVAKASGSITGTPTGDGTSYTSSLVFGSGTSFDGGYVVYKGITSPQTVTGLTNGTLYYFKFFSRKGSGWSTGVETSVTPVAAAIGDYRSAASSNWTTLSTWQRFNGTAWVTPTAGQGTPTSASGNITIRNNHTDTANSNISVNEVTIDPGGGINFNANITLTVANGTGNDLTNNGTITVNGRASGAGALTLNGQLQNNGTVSCTNFNANYGSFNVNSGATLICSSASVVSGNGDFNLLSGGTIEIGSADGISALGTNTGNIRTTHVRNFSTSANYIYKGDGQQATGNGLPTTAITGNVSIATGSVLTTTNSVIENGTLTVDGILIPGASTHTISGTGTITGTGIVQVNQVSGISDFSSQYSISNKTLTSLTLDYAGTALQGISNGDFPGNSVYRIIGNNSNGVTLSGNISLSDLTINSGKQFTISAGNILAASNIVNNAGITGLVLKSDATGDAQLLNNTPNVPATVELYLTGGLISPTVGIFHYFVPPVTSMTIGTVPTIAEVKTAMGITNFKGDLLRYIEPNAVTNKNQGWQYFDNYPSTPPGFLTIESGRGYNFFLNPNSEAVKFKGNLNATQHTFSLSYTTGNAGAGWNLVGNPFPCNYDLNGVEGLGTIVSGISNTVYYNNNGTYTYWNVLTNTGSSGGYTDILPPMTGFFVKLSSGGPSSLTFPVSSKTSASSDPRGLHKGAADPYSKGSTVQKVKLLLSKDTKTDETVALLFDDAADSYNEQYDAYKLFTTGSTSPNIYIAKNGTDYFMKAVKGPVTGTVTIPLKVVVKETGTHTLTVTEFQNLVGIKTVLKHGSIETLLNQGTTYTFTLGTGTFTNFELVLGEEGITTDVENPVKSEFKTWYNNDAIYINSPKEITAGLSGIIIYDLQGKQVYNNRKISIPAGETVQFPVNLAGGIYLVEIRTGGIRMVEKVVAF